MTKRILITGARAPVALELARHFAQAGHVVFAADSVRFPLTRASVYIKKYFILPPPRSQLQQFGAKLEEIVRAQKIDLLVPTCEEIFFIARLRQQLLKHCDVFCDEFAKLQALHSKWNFLNLGKGCGISVPASERLQSIADVLPLLSNTENLVFKPEFSRFASKILISPTSAQLQTINPSPQYPWIAQQKIKGKEYCTYSIAYQGKLVAHACYHPRYRVGLGSSIYFDPQPHQGIGDFVAEFVSKTKFHGQIGFDFIEDSHGEVFVLECNPRATSGAHLFANKKNFGNLFFSSTTSMATNSSSPCMIAPAMIFFSLKEELKQGRIKQFMNKFFAAHDVCFSMRDPIPSIFQYLSLLEIVYKSIVQNVDFKEAATADIEWNGEILK